MAVLDTLRSPREGGPDVLVLMAAARVAEGLPAVVQHPAVTTAHESFEHLLSSAANQCAVQRLQAFHHGCVALHCQCAGALRVCEHERGCGCCCCC